MSDVDVYLNTLFYTTSTIAQVVVAIGALVVALCVFRIAVLRDYLVGDGRSMQDRIEVAEIGYKFVDEREREIQFGRIRDAVSRKNIREIKKIAERLRHIEVEEGFSKQDRPTGLQHVFDRFEHTEAEIRTLKNGMTTVGLLSLEADKEPVLLAIVQSVWQRILKQTAARARWFQASMIVGWRS